MSTVNKCWHQEPFQRTAVKTLFCLSSSSLSCQYQLAVFQPGSPEIFSYQQFITTATTVNRMYWNKQELTTNRHPSSLISHTWGTHKLIDIFTCKECKILRYLRQAMTSSIVLEIRWYHRVMRLNKQSFLWLWTQQKGLINDLNVCDHGIERVTTERVN